MTHLLIALLLGGTPNNVQWQGVSHLPEFDRRPLCPVDGQSFDVQFQTYKFDITGARVYFDDGAPAFVDAVYLRDRGPYAVWSATLPATAASTVQYYIELTDGTDVDYYGTAGMRDTAPPQAEWFTINYTTLEHAPFGATPLPGGGAVFKVWAPTPTAAFVRGEFNGWGTTNPMTKIGSNFIARVNSAQVGQQYKYFFTPGNIWNADPRARRLNPIDNYNSFILDPFSYEWVVDDFQVPAFEDMVIYELHVGTFSGRNDPVASGAIPGTYRDVAAHADHLAELGINVVHLMPVNEFPWDFSAGYNPITMYAPEWRHGTPDDLKYMIDTLHQHGIAVIHDIVWNHFSGSDNYLWNYDGAQIYFDSPAVETPWGSQADVDRPEVRDYFLDSAVSWFEEFHINGFRFDSSEYMKSPVPGPVQAGGWTIMGDLNNLVDNRYADALVNAEQLPDDSFITRPTSLGGAGFDAQWYDYFTDTLRGQIFAMAFGDPSMGALADILDGSGPDLYGTKVINYLELHDECWPSSGGERIVNTIDTTAPHDDEFAQGRVKLGQGFVMFAPGIPEILQGSEWLEPTNFGGGSPAGADRINWALKSTYSHIFQYFKDIIRIRKENPAFRANAGVQITHVNEGGNVIAWQRFDGSGNVMFVIANFSNLDFTNYRLGLPQAGPWYELINSQSAIYQGNNLGNGGQVTSEPTPYDGFAQSANFVIPRMGLLVFRWNVPPVTECPGDLTGDNATDLGDLGALFGCWGTPCGDLTGDGNTDLGDLGVLFADWNCGV